jgi:hypothetical protein
MLIGEFAVSSRLSMATVDDFFVADEKEKRQNEVFADQPNVTIVDADLGMDTKKLKSSKKEKKKVGSVKNLRSSILKSNKETLAEFEMKSLTYRHESPMRRAATGNSPPNPKSIRFSAVDQDDILDESNVEKLNKSNLSREELANQGSEKFVIGQGQRKSVNMVTMEDFVLNKVSPDSPAQKKDSGEEASDPGSPGNDLFGTNGLLVSEIIGTPVSRVSLKSSRFTKDFTKIGKMSLVEPGKRVSFGPGELGFGGLSEKKTGFLESGVIQDTVDQLEGKMCEVEQLVSGEIAGIDGGRLAESEIESKGAEVGGGEDDAPADILEDGSLGSDKRVSFEEASDVVGPAEMVEPGVESDTEDEQWVTVVVPPAARTGLERNMEFVFKTAVCLGLIYVLKEYCLGIMDGSEILL